MSDTETPAGAHGSEDEARLEASRMPLGQHLEELRRCLIRSFIVFVVLFVVGMIFYNELIEFVLLPYEWARARIVDAGDPDPGELVFLGPAEGFLFAMKVAGTLALMGGSPLFLRELWGFVGAGLLERERKAIFKAFPLAVGLLLLGLTFGFLLMLPLAYPILLTFVEQARPSITLTEYFSSLRTLTLLMGFVFELPVLMWLAVRAGIVRYESLATSRKVAVVVMLIFAALMTPPDVVTQMLVVLPMVLLYEVGLMLARKAEAARGG